MTRIKNAAHETIVGGLSDAAAARWWLENGRSGDYLDDTGEGLASVVPQIFPGASWRFDPNGSVIDGTTGEEDT